MLGQPCIKASNWVYRLPILKRAHLQFNSLDELVVFYCVQAVKFFCRNVKNGIQAGHRFNGHIFGNTIMAGPKPALLKARSIFNVCMDTCSRSSLLQETRLYFPPRLLCQVEHPDMPGASVHLRPSTIAAIV